MLNIKCCKLTYARIPEYLYYYEDYKTLETVIMILVTSCNKQIIDLQYSYNYAYIELPNGETVSERIDSWTDYGDGDQLQVTINGNVYLVHSSDCVLVYYKSM